MAFIAYKGKYLTTKFKTWSILFTKDYRLMVLNEALDIYRSELKQAEPDLTHLVRGQLTRFNEEIERILKTKEISFRWGIWDKVRRNLEGWETKIYHYWLQTHLEDGRPNSDEFEFEFFGPYEQFPGPIRAVHKKGNDNKPCQNHTREDTSASLSPQRPSLIDGPLGNSVSQNSSFCAFSASGTHLRESCASSPSRS